MTQMQLGAAQRPAVGETVCGDAYVMVERGARKLIAVVDGSGHGPLAAEAAHLFRDFVSLHAAEPLELLFLGAHAALADTRGAAASILRVDESSGALEFAGIGNVHVVAQSASAIHPAPQPGILGRRFRHAKVLPFSVARGDTLVMFSDGISSRVQLAPYLHLDPDAMARAILAEHGASHDDATCVALRFA